jgi:hypothetical protein
MKKHTQLLVFLLLVNFSSLAQAPDRFVQNYHFPPNFDSQSYGVANADYGYMLAGMSIDTVGNPGAYWAFTVSGVDAMGNQLWYKRYPMAYNQNMCNGWFTHDFLKKINGFYYATFYVHDIGTEDYTSYLVKLDDQGDTLWTKHLIGDAQDPTLETRSFSKTNDGGFLISGLTGPLNGETKSFLLKTDSYGNAQWKKKYNLSNEAEYVFAAVQDSITNKIVMVGYKNTNNKSFVCILDSLGNLLQQKYFNSSDGGWLYNVKQSTDGDFIAVGSEYTGNTLGSFKMSKPMTLKFDINGNLIWKNVTGYESIGNSFFSVLIENDNTMLSIGYMDTLFTQNVGINGLLCIEKTTFSGTTVSRNLIDIFNLHTNGVYQTLIKSQHGGYATAAYNLNGISPNPFVLIKLDEWACLNEGCQYAGIEENETDNEVNIFPNPASETLTISLPENALNTECMLFDNLGKEVLRINVLGGDNLLDIKELESGLYTAQVNNHIIKLIKN